jgi:hypothetical protein
LLARGPNIQYYAIVIEDAVQVCAVLRYFKADTPYLYVEDSCIHKLDEKDRQQLCKELRHFNNYPFDNYLVVREYYIGRGKSHSVLQDNVRAFFFPLFSIGVKPYY